jgi:hypothetical protein
VASTTEGLSRDVPIVTKQLIGRVDNSGYPSLNVTILATLTTPRNASGPVPVLMFGAGGRLPEGVPPTTLCVVGGSPARGGALPAAGTLAGRGAAPPAPANAPPTAQEQILMRGWGYASVARTNRWIYFSQSFPFYFGCGSFRTRSISGFCTDCRRERTEKQRL